MSVDTTVLVRAVVSDEAAQARAAARMLSAATLIAIATSCFREFVWVLRKVYGFDAQAVGESLRALLAADNVRMNRSAVEAGLSLLEGGNARNIPSRLL